MTLHLNSGISGINFLHTNAFFFEKEKCIPTLLGELYNIRPPRMNLWNQGFWQEPCTLMGVWII